MPSLDERVTAALAEAQEPLPFADLRARCRVRAATLHERIGLLAAAGRIHGPDRWKTMRLHPHEFIRRFLLHVLPKGFHRVRHYGLFANASRAANIARARVLLGPDPPAADPPPEVKPEEPRAAACPCPRCGARMIVIEVFARGCEPRWRPTPGRVDTS